MSAEPHAGFHTRSRDVTLRNRLPASPKRDSAEMQPKVFDPYHVKPRQGGKLFE